MDDSTVEVLPPGYIMPPTNVAAALQPVAATDTSAVPPSVTYPSVPRLPMQDNAIALIQGESGSGWGVLRDVVETTGVLAIAMYLVGNKEHVVKSALAGAVLIEATIIAYTAAAIRMVQNGTPKGH